MAVSPEPHDADPARWTGIPGYLRLARQIALGLACLPGFALIGLISSGVG